MSATSPAAGSGTVPAPLAASTEEGSRARLALAAALASGPGHAYLLRGPRGVGKRAAARAFAAEILASGAADPESARRRALLDPSPHPDLVWLSPPGTQHLVEDVREQVIKGAAYRPFEGEHRVFVIEAAEALGDESQNALLKTLEEPAGFAHLILISSEPDTLAETILSRCQEVHFEPLSAEAVASRLAQEGADPEAGRAAARLCAGNLERARFLLSGPGRSVREQAERCARFSLEGRVAEAPWTALLAGAEEAGELASEEVEAGAEIQLEGSADRGKEAGRIRRQAVEDAKRAARRERTVALDLGLELVADWFRDLAAVGEGAEHLILNADRLAELRADAAELDPGRCRAAVELVLQTRRALRLNVSEQLAMEALFFRIEDLFGGGPAHRS